MSRNPDALTRMLRRAAIALAALAPTGCYVSDLYNDVAALDGGREGGSGSAGIAGGGSSGSGGSSNGGTGGAGGASGAGASGGSSGGSGGAGPCTGDADCIGSEFWQGCCDAGVCGYRHDSGCHATKACMPTSCPGGCCGGPDGPCTPVPATGSCSGGSGGSSGSGGSGGSASCVPAQCPSSPLAAGCCQPAGGCGFQVGSTCSPDDMCTPARCGGASACCTSAPDSVCGVMVGAVCQPANVDCGPSICEPGWVAPTTADIARVLPRCCLDAVAGACGFVVTGVCEGGACDPVACAAQLTNPGCCLTVDGPCGTRDAAGYCGSGGGTGDCSPNPCQNGGTCNDLAGSGTYSCTCVSGFNGPVCELGNACVPNPCQNGGVCQWNGTAVTCTCPAGTSGLQCQTLIDPCTPNPCLNGGSCASVSGAAQCTCPTTFTGAHCDVDVDECTTGTHGCDANATCANLIGGYTCTCNAGYSGSGTACTNIDDCAASPCYTGTCIDGVNGYTCVCPTGSVGLRCESCAPGWANCDAVAANGCEVDTANLTSHCGGCNQGCFNSWGTTACSGGVCVPTCSTGRGDCDGNPRNGCESDTGSNPNACGSCSNVCAAPSATSTCTGGTCGYNCYPGRGDCDGQAANGCETDLLVDRQHCGACTTVCTLPGGTPTLCAAGCTTDVSAAAVTLWAVDVVGPWLALWQDGEILDARSDAALLVNHLTGASASRPATFSRPTLFLDASNASANGGYSGRQGFHEDGTDAWSWPDLGCCNSVGQPLLIDAVRRLAWLTVNGALVSASLDTGAAGPSAGGSVWGGYDSARGNRLFTAGFDGQVAAYDLSPAASAWTQSFDPGTSPRLLPGAVGNDGHFVLVSQSGKFGRYSTTGVQTWSYTAGGSTPPVIDESDTIFVGTVEPSVIAHQPGGAQLWRTPLLSPIVDLLVANDGTLYVLEQQGIVSVLWRATGAIDHRYVGLRGGGGEMLLRGGVLYVTSGDRLYALTVLASGYPPGAAWPVRGHDNQRTSHGDTTLVF